MRSLLELEISCPREKETLHPLEDHARNRDTATIVVTALDALGFAGGVGRFHDTLGDGDGGAAGTG